MFEDLFAVYTNVEPPQIYVDNLDLLNIENSEEDVDPISLSIFNAQFPSYEFPGVVSPFEQGASYEGLQIPENYIKIPSEEVIKKFPKEVSENIIKPDTKKGEFKTHENFAKALNSTYRKVLKKRGLDPNYSYVLTAAAALESGWGQHLGGTFNYGGVKSKKGNSAITTDYINGRYVTRSQTFKNYSSIEDYCDRVITLLSNKRYNAFNQYSASEPFKLWRHVLDAGYGGGDAADKAAYVNSVRDIYKDIKRMTTVKKSTNVQDKSLIKIDIEELLKQEGITSINGKRIKFGNKGLRPANAGYGSKKSHHKERDPHTGNANARDISIVGGNYSDYAEFRRLIMANDRVRSWLAQKNWGIINEITPAIMNHYGSTGPHFHFGPDLAARRTWKGWLDNPNVNITKAF